MHYSNLQWEEKIANAVGSRIDKNKQAGKFAHDLRKTLAAALVEAVRRQNQNVFLKHLENSIEKTIKSHLSIDENIKKLGPVGYRLAISYRRDSDNILSLLKEFKTLCKQGNISRSGPKAWPQYFIALTIAGLYWNHFKKLPTISTSSTKSSFQNICHVIGDYFIDVKKSHLIGVIGTRTCSKAAKTIARYIQRNPNYKFSIISLRDL